MTRFVHVSEEIDDTYFIGQLYDEYPDEDDEEELKINKKRRRAKKPSIKHMPFHPDEVRGD